MFYTNACSVQHLPPATQAHPRHYPYSNSHNSFDQCCNKESTQMGGALNPHEICRSHTYTILQQCTGVSMTLNRHVRRGVCSGGAWGTNGSPVIDHESARLALYTVKNRIHKSCDQSICLYYTDSTPPGCFGRVCKKLGSNVLSGRNCLGLSVHLRGTFPQFGQ